MKEEKLKSTKKHSEQRAIAVLVAFAIFATYLLFTIFRLTYFMYDYYRDKTYDQVTTSSTLGARRGNIYDSNMNLLATSSTVWRVFVSTRDIKLAEKESGTEYSRIISSGLADILSMSADTIYTKIKNSNILDVTIKKSVSES